MEAAALLNRIETLLGSKPEGQTVALGELAKELEKQREEKNYQIVESSFQLLGTAVGKDSAIDLAHKCYT